MCVLLLSDCVALKFCKWLVYELCLCGRFWCLRVWPWGIHVFICLGCVCIDLDCMCRCLRPYMAVCVCRGRGLPILCKCSCVNQSNVCVHTQYGVSLLD